VRFVFGPVSSRRLGRSLGIDPVPFKTCNYSCVYCQLGRTLYRPSHRQRFYRPAEILDEVDATLDAVGSSELDAVSFVGSGETTLYDGLGELIDGVKSRTDTPVAVITNGSLLSRPDVREELSRADAVLPSLDAGDERTFREINRPAGQVQFEEVVEGLRRFAAEYRGRLWLECMLVDGINADPGSLARLAAVTRELAPDGVQINIPVRPPAETWVRPPSRRAQEQAAALLGDTGYLARKVRDGTGMVSGEDAQAAILSIIRRHPMRGDELARCLRRWDAGDVARALRSLERRGQVQRIERLGHGYWSWIGARYPDSSPRAPRTHTTDDGSPIPEGPPTSRKSARRIP